MKKKKISAKGGSASSGKNKKTSRGKKNVKTFLRSEKGKINKRAAARLGMAFLAAGMGLSGLMKAGFSNADVPGGTTLY